jgi:copper(I)-binding protein/predicted peroxiredoxin
MSRYFRLLFLVILLLAVVACNNTGASDPASPGGGAATAVTVGDLTISDVRANMTLPTETGSFWMFIANNGSTDDALIGAEVAGCGVIELHDMVINDAGVMIMREVEGGRIPIPAGETVELKRGGLHVMCLQKTAPLAEGTMTEIALQFANAGKVTIPAAVVAPTEMPGMGHDSGMSGGHMGMTSESGAAHSGEEFKNGLFVNLTSDELNRAAMAISFATRTRQDMDKPVTIFLNVEGVRLAHKDAPQEPYGMDGKTIHDMLQAFMAAGGKVLVCPMCMMNVAGGMTADDLIPGAMVSNPDLTRAALFSEGVTVLSY